MSALEINAQWLAVLAYVVAAMIAGSALIFRCGTLGWSLALLITGAGSQLGALVLRWLETGHGPYLGRYEAFSSHALAVVAIFLLLQWHAPALRPGVIFVASVAFILLGVAVLAPSAPTYPSPALNSPWLTIHVSLAKLAFAFAIASGSAALVSLMERPLSRFDPAPTLLKGGGRKLETLAHQLLGYTFFLMTLVILAGSVWASVAWGSYWSWDPVETWSLAFWASSAFVLHLRTHADLGGQGWSASVVALTALGLITFVGYGHFGVSLHAAYIQP